jgi:uncharacterized protein GlcG (DUF336 family)
VIPLRTKPTLTEAAVDAVLEAGREAAGSLGCHVSVVIVDDALTPRAAVRTDDADVLTLGLATGKARLVAANGMPTGSWRGLVADDALLGLTLPIALDRLLDGAVFFGGGYPIRVDGSVIGGVGVSGGSESEDDLIACRALAGLPQAEQFVPEAAGE